MTSLFSRITNQIQIRMSLADRGLECAVVQRWLPGYLDGAMPDGRGKGDLRAGVTRHLGQCARCRAELESYQAISRVMWGVPANTRPPDDLAVAIRIAVDRSREMRGANGLLGRLAPRLGLLLDNMIEPLVVPVAGGAIVALIVFALVFPVLGGGLHLPLAIKAADLPTSLMQPARLQKLAGFPVPGLSEGNERQEAQGLFVEATVNESGEAVSYRVIGSPLDAGTQRQLDRVVFFSQFRPQLSFGKPTATGRVVLGFSRVVVRG
jgi:hypothetical protein